MITEKFSPIRELKQVAKTYHIVIVGGGLAGVCAAIAAAREGSSVALVQDRPVLGGNASSEVRLWALGATSHMGNNNRWAREGGIVNEIMTENLFRNREGNPVIFDSVLIDKVLQEKNIDLFLNNSVYAIQKSSEEMIEKVIGINTQNSTIYEFSAKMFIDASGDGIVAYLSGIPYRIGAESPDEFKEPLAQDVEDYGELLGHTLFFYSKKTDEPVAYKAPEFALKEVKQIPKINRIKAGVDGCNLWWFEYGGRRDTIHDTEEIKYELWKVVYGIWDHVKNSGKFENADCLTLEWVGLIPGKRESRRFEGLYMLTQADIVEQRIHHDAISYGGWAIDLHPADGVYSEKESCSQWHSKGLYQIPLRCFIPKGIKNLMLAGRIISTSHVAFGSTRVMATCAHGGQAVGVAASLVAKNQLHLVDLLQPEPFEKLQQRLLVMGHYIPGHNLNADNNLLSKATLKASSSLMLSGLPLDGGWENLDFSFCQMFPSPIGIIPAIQIRVKSDRKTELKVQLRVSSKVYNHTPDVLLEEIVLRLEEGERNITLEFEQEILNEQYMFLCLMENTAVSIRTSKTRITGILSLFNQTNRAVSNYGKQVSNGNGMEEFEFWTPRRRPLGQNLAFQLSVPIEAFTTQNVLNGINRPVNQPNAWVAELNDEHPTIRVSWDQPQKISKINLHFDGDYDHPMETVQLLHPESRIPFCVSEGHIEDEKGNLIAEIRNNYQPVFEYVLKKPIKAQELIFYFSKSNPDLPVSLLAMFVQNENSIL
jgi:hypothetical protein